MGKVPYVLGSGELKNLAFFCLIVVLLSVLLIGHAKQHQIELLVVDLLLLAVMASLIRCEFKQLRESTSLRGNGICDSK